MGIDTQYEDPGRLAYGNSKQKTVCQLFYALAFKKVLSRSKRNVNPPPNLGTVLFRAGISAGAPCPRSPRCMR